MTPVPIAQPVELQPFWYRIEYDSLGKLLSCTRVEESKTDTTLVFYVQAIDKDDARVAAAHRWKQYIEGQRSLLRERRKKHVAAGKCRCGRPVPNGKQCRTCLDGAKRAHQRKAAKERGEPVVVPPKSIAFAANKQEQLDSVRLETLLECQRMLLKARNYADWLERKIRSLQPQKQAGKKAA